MNYNQSPVGWTYPTTTNYPYNMQQPVLQNQYQQQMPVGGTAPNIPLSSTQPQTPFVGRYISDISETLPSETPMDGRISLFPTKDLQAIYLKSWNSDGRLLVFRYILDPSQNLNASAQPQEDTTRIDILKRLDQLEKQVASNTKKPSQRNSGKGEE